MKNGIYRLVYCSRNRIQGGPEQINAEIHDILKRARANNEEAGVTGALLFNAGNFAQSLEGPLEAVERIFEKVQNDMRHTEVTIVDSGNVAERIFGDWSMAMCGDPRLPPVPLTVSTFDAAFGKKEGAGDQILGLLTTLVMQDSDTILV